MDFTGYKAQVIKTENGFKVTWVDREEVEKDRWSLNPLFRMAMEIMNIAIQRSSDQHPFYWVNGRKSWSIDQCNTILDHIGIVNFLHTLEDNTGGASYKYAISMLNAYRHYLKERKPGTFTYQVDILLEWMKENIQDFHLIKVPPFQECGEEGGLHLVNQKGTYSEYWEWFD